MRLHLYPPVRRQVLEQTAVIALLNEAAFAETGELDLFRREHSKLRPPIAHHMASWPFIGIDRDNNAYISSFISIRDVYPGAPLRSANTRTWRAALKACGIENFRWHDLRHTWATWLRQNDVPTWVLQELGGWKSETMVRR